MKLLCLRLLTGAALAATVAAAADNKTVAAAKKEDAPAFARYTPAGVVPAGGGGFYLAGNAFSAPDKSSCWVWKVGADGEKVWEKTVAATDQDEIIGLLPQDDGGLVVMGVSFVHQPEVGYRSWLRTFGKDGKPGEKHFVDGYGRAGVFLKAPGGDYLLACTAEREKSRYKRDYDVRILECDPTGKVEWEKFHDKGDHEGIVAGAPLADGRFVFLATRRTPDGTAGLWLFTASAQGVLTGEQRLAGARIAASEGCFLARGKDSLAVIYSLAPPPAAGEDLEIGTDVPAGAQVANFTLSLEPLKESVLKDYPAVTPPVIAATADGGYLVAGASAEGLRIEKLDADWKPLWNKGMKSDAEGFINFTVRQLVADGDVAYLVGNLASPVSGNFNKNVFLAKIDLRKPGFVWFKAY